MLLARRCYAGALSDQQITRRILDLIGVSMDTDTEPDVAAVAARATLRGVRNAAASIIAVLAYLAVQVPLWPDADELAEIAIAAVRGAALMALCRQRERVAKANAGQYAAELRADFERKLAAVFHWHQCRRVAARLSAGAAPMSGRQSEPKLLAMGPDVSLSVLRSRPALLRQRIANLLANAATGRVDLERNADRISRVAEQLVEAEEQIAGCFGAFGPHTPTAGLA